MLSGIDLVDSTVERYPKEMQAKLAEDIRELLWRDRAYTNSQIQMLLSQEVVGLRRQIDLIMLENRLKPSKTL